jgi:hypothetical protein
MAATPSRGRTQPGFRTTSLAIVAMVALIVMAVTVVTAGLIAKRVD